MTTRPYRMRALTGEIGDTVSPVRQFLNQRFMVGFREVQGLFRGSAPVLVVAPVPVSEANPGTVGGAADWLLRFLVFPHPNVNLAMAGAARHLGPRMMRATAELAVLLKATLRPYSGPVATPDPADATVLAEMSHLIASVGAVARGPATFTGPVAGSDMDEQVLAR